MNRLSKFSIIGLLVLILIAMVSAVSWGAPGPERTTNEIEKDLRATQGEIKKFKDLHSKLESAGRQSSNAARQKVIQKLQDFMGECVQRREGDLGEDITIKQHGKMVQSGTTDAALYGKSDPNKKTDQSEVVNSDRLRQLSGMKSIYVGAKNNSRPAIERQGEAFDRYTETIGKFGQQLEWGANAMTRELEKRSAGTAKNTN